MALGATAPDVVALLMREGLAMPVAGIAAGLAIAACYVPARLATRVDPVRAPRQD